MMKTIFISGLLLLASLNAVAQEAATPPVQAQPETFQAAATSSAKLRRLPVNSAARALNTTRVSQVALPALSKHEISQLQRQQGREKAYRVGLGRALPSTLSNTIDLNTWQWHSVSGGQVAHFSMTSPDALRVRAEVYLDTAPAGVELRFYAPADPSHVTAVYGSSDKQFWSPTVAGDTLGLELFLPEGIKPSQVSLRIPRLSHLALDPASSSLKSSSILKASSDCQVDIACASPAWQQTGKAVARYVFTDTDGFSYLCSGTLLADLDNSTQIPYFLSANHCVNNQQAASSMDFFWLYANSTCGGNDAKPTQTTHGAQLLMNNASLDTTLVRLSTNPPSGVTMAGWTTTPLNSNQAVTGIHHGSGAPKKYASGVFQQRIRIADNGTSYIVYPDNNGDFSQIRWSTGITSPGSSGSGLWVEQNGVHYLNGSLVGGSSECANPTSPDEYSRFERTWPLVSQWLGTPASSPSLRLLDSNKPPNALVEGVIISRYLQGTRGTALISGVTSQALDISVLENKLASVANVLDIDNDGSKSASQDGLLLNRYLLGLRGAPLTQGLDLSKAQRNTPSAIASYIASLL